MIICTFETLSYTSDLRFKFMKELMRILQKGAPIIFTVRNKLGYLRNIFASNQMDMLLDPLKSGIWELLESGYKQHDEDEPAFYSFTSQELSKFVTSNYGEILELRAVNIFLDKNIPKLLEIRNSDVAWKNILEIEQKLATRDDMQNTGEVILVVARKSVI
jgi:hypothetical protein